MMQEHEPAEGYLAEQLGTDPASFVEVFGAGWRVMPTMHDYDADPSGTFDSLYGPWCVSGEPPQLMMRVTHDEVQLAVPRRRSMGFLFTLVPGETHRLGLQEWAAPETGELVARLVRKRRSSFAYCRYCRSLIGPESRHDRNLCTACASRWLRVVY